MTMMTVFRREGGISKIPSLSSLPSLGEGEKFREAVRPPFSKGDEHWGAIHRWRGKAPYPLGERKGTYDTKCQKCFCVTFAKSNKTPA